MTEEKSEYIRRMADDGLGNLADDSEIQDNISDDLATLGVVTDVLEDVPSSATIRASGLFSDSQDALEYLELGGLVSTVDGENVPMSFVYFYEYYDDDLQADMYQVYIDEDS